MKKAFFLATVFVLTVTLLHSQGIHPDLIPLSVSEQQQMTGLPELKLPPQYQNKSLPVEVDNSALMYYPGLFLQGGLSCGQAAAITLGFSYEICRLRNQNGSNAANNFPTHFTWNWENGGLGYYGVSYYHSLEVLRLVGCPTTAVYGGTYDSGGGSRWMSGYDSYYNAMQNRIQNAYVIKTNTEEGILTLKHWINDHLDGSETGGVAFFYSQYQSPSNTLPAGTPHSGERVIVSWGSSPNHGMNICGYNDEIKWDYNGDGQYTNHIDINSDGVVDVRDWEIGAFKMANTYSSPYYAWMMYKTLADASSQGGIWNNAVNVLEAKANYQPQLTYKINIYYTHRKRIKIRAGMSTNVLDTEPAYIIEYPIINYQGGDMGMQGGNEEEQKYLEFGLDVTPFLNYLNPGDQAKFFFEIVEEDPDVWGNGNVISFSLMDYTSGLVETPCSQTNVPIVHNEKTQLSIVRNINYSPVNITSSVLPMAEVYHDYSYQLAVSGGTPPYYWEFDVDYDVLSSTASMPGDITTSFSGSSINLPFAVNFYGNEYTKIYVSNDGYLDFSGESFSLPYQHEMMSAFMNRPCIAACMMDLNASVFYKLTDDYVAFRWNKANFIETAIRIYANGNIELFYGSSDIPYDEVWISGVSSGNQMNYNLFQFSSSPNLPENLKYSLTPRMLPEEFYLTTTGLLTGSPTQELLAYNLSFKVYDSNMLIDRKTIPISTNGLIVSAELHTNNNDTLEWGEYAWFNVSLRNATDLPMTNLSIALSTTNNQVSLVQLGVGNLNLSPGQELLITEAFTLNTLYDFTNGQIIPFVIAAVCDQSSWDIPISVPIYTAVLQNTDQWVDDNDNHRLDLGETSDVHFFIENSGGSGVGDLNFTISTNDPFISLNSTTYHIESLAPGSDAPTIFNISASDEAPVGYLAFIQMHITGDHNYDETLILKLTIGQIIEDWETGDFSRFEWELSGDQNWFISNDNVYDGQFSLKSGPITHNQVSDLSIALEVISSGNISFYRAVSCENDVNDNWDYLSFTIDGNEIARWDGQQDWEQFTYPVNAGVHVFRWRYRKDGSVNSFQDCAWIDNIVFPSIYDAPPLLVLSHDSIVKHMNSNEIDIDTLYVMNNGGGILNYYFEVLNVLPSQPRSIAGSTVVCGENTFTPGSDVNWTFTVHNNSPDNEWIKQVYLDFPTGVTVTSSTDCISPNGSLASSGTIGNGVIISWFGEDDNGWGIIHGNSTGTMNVEASIDENFEGDLDIEYQLHGDIYGAEPHMVGNEISLINLGPPIDWMSIDPLVGQVIIGEIDTILISFNTNGMEMGIYECMLRIYSVADTISLPVTLHVDMGVGREDVFLSSALQVYPNPSVDVFTIYSDAKLGELHYEITDISGRSLWNTNSSESLLQWNPASDVASGVYFLTVKNSSMQITQKIILNK